MPTNTEFGPDRLRYAGLSYSVEIDFSAPKVITII